MIVEKVQEARRLSERTGNHISFCMMQIAKEMSDSEIQEFAADAYRRAGENRSEVIVDLAQKLETYDVRSLVLAEIADWMQTANRQKWS